MNDNAESNEQKIEENATILVDDSPIENNSENAEQSAEKDNEKTEQDVNNKPKSKFEQKLDKKFLFTQRGSSVKQEFFAGFVNFLVLSYIMVVIPSLFTGIGGEGFWKAIFLATILTAIVITTISAFYSNLPIVLAPGIGLVSYLAQLVTSGEYTFPQVMSISLIAGVVFVILTVSGLRKKIVRAIPNCVKDALPVGVGLFILSLGLSSNNSGILDLLSGNATSYTPIVAIVSLIIMCVLYAKKVKGSIFVGIASGTILDIIIKFCKGINPFEVLSQSSWLPPFKELAENTLFQFDFAGLVQGNVVSGLLSVLLIIFAVVLIDMFDTVGTLYATATKGNLIDKNGEVINMDKLMLVDGSATLFTSLIGIPNASSYVESSTGIASGARTGLSAIFTSLFFALAMFLSPLVQLIPVYATSPALILVGILMFDSVKKIDFTDFSTAIPSVLTILIMPLASDITTGIAVGMIMYVFIMLLTKRAKKVNVLTYIISALFIAYFVMKYI